ncbi:chromosome partitioning protein ParB [Ferrovum sp.]|uniref:chromosome partitioning protein ParB n=1 Tax=Ferrovum sp. TaxID=2609467 RepID=UPI00262EA0FA|nr:chromosome partitioning protein ParB [Ferrovum sp.]
MSKQGTLTAGRPSATKNRTATLASLVDDTTMKRVNFELPADQHTKLKIYATKQGKTIKELLTEYVVQLPE